MKRRRPRRPSTSLPVAVVNACDTLAADPHPEPIAAWRFDLDGEELVILALDWRLRPDCAALTEAERAVLQLLLEGQSNAEIARARGTTPRTVANQVASIFVKTKTRSRSELFVWCGGATGRA